MAASNTGGVLLKAEESKVIKIPNFSRLHAGYVEGGLYLQDAALKTMVVRVFPCGRRHSTNREYVCIVFKKQWIGSFPLNFHCTASIIDVYGERVFRQTCGMEALKEYFEIDQFVKRSTLFENGQELLPNDTLTVLCEVSYTMPSSPRSSKIWSILRRLYAWQPPKNEDFDKTQEEEEMCSLVVKTMDGGEFLLPTPSSYFAARTKETAESPEEFCESSQEPENSNILSSALMENSVKDLSIQSHISSRDTATSVFASCNSIQTEPHKNAFKKDSTISNKKVLCNLISDFSAAGEKKDIPGLFSAVTAMLSIKNMSEETHERTITKESKEKTPSAFSSKTFFEMDYKNKTLSDIEISNHAACSKDGIPEIKKSISNTRSKVKRIKPKPEVTETSNAKILDVGSKKTVQGSDVCEASPVFACMLKNTMLESSTKRVTLENIDADTFDNFLYYLETREIIAENFEKLCDLYKMADQYAVMDLMGDCTLRLAQTLDIDNFLIVLELAEMHCDNKLKRKVHKFFLQNEKDIWDLLQNDPAFLEWYDSWKKEDTSSNTETSDDEVEVCDDDLDFYR